MARAICVELYELLAGRGVSRLLEVRVETTKEGGRSLGEAVGLVGGLGPLSGMDLGVEALQSRHEAAGYAVLLVQFETALEGGIANDVSVGKVFSQDAAARLLLLSDLVTVTLRIGGVAGGLIRISVIGCDSDLGTAELGVV